MASSVLVRAPRLALLSGSTRKGSFNTKLIAAADKMAQNLGAETTLVDLQNYPLPLYHQDDESRHGLPEEARHLKDALGEADAWIVSSPEYNGGLSPLLVNAYTWCSRGDDEGVMYATFSGKSALILSASPGGLGGMRNHSLHTQLLQNLGVLVLPQSVAVGAAHQAFDEKDELKPDGKHAKMLEQALHSLFLTARDTANRDATCQLVQEHMAMVGTYGDVPQ